MNMTAMNTQATQQQTLAVICATCPHHVHGHERPATLPTDKRLALCEISDARTRVPIPVRLTLAMCPLGKFPRPQASTPREETAAPRRGCGCGVGGGGGGNGNASPRHAPQQVSTGASIVLWPRSAQQRQMWRMDAKTRRPRASVVWAPWLKGVAWYGIPMPLRWWIMLRHGVVRRYEGCGCLVAVKRAAPWLEGPLALLEQLRLGAVAPAAVWWHDRWTWQDTVYGRVQVENEAWEALPGVRPQHRQRAAWGLAVMLMLAVLCLARAVV